MTATADDAALAVLHEQLESDRPLLRLQAAETLARTTGFVATDVLQALLDSGRQDFRRRAAAILLKHGRPTVKRGTGRYADGTAIPPDARGVSMTFDPATGEIRDSDDALLARLTAHELAELLL